MPLPKEMSLISAHAFQKIDRFAVGNTLREAVRRNARLGRREGRSIGAHPGFIDMRAAFEADALHHRQGRAAEILDGWFERGAGNPHRPRCG